MRTHPVVDEVIAVGILVGVGRGSDGRDRGQAGQTLDPRALIEWLTPRLPYFAVPRFVRIVM